MFALDGICMQMTRWLSLLLRLPFGWMSDVCLGCSLVFWGLSTMTMTRFTGLFFTACGMFFVLWGAKIALKPYALLFRYGRGFIDTIERQVTFETVTKTNIYLMNGHRLTYTLFRLVPVFAALWCLSFNEVLPCLAMLMIGCSYYAIAQHYYQKARL